MKKLSILLAGLLFGFSSAQLTAEHEFTYERTSNNIHITTDGVEAECEYGVEEDPETTTGSFVGDFSSIIVANHTIVPANTTFTFQEMEIYPTTGVGGQVWGATFYLYKDNEGSPGELILGDIYIEPIDQFINANINFTNGETAEELYVLFDISELGEVTTGSEDEKYWIGYLMDYSPTPLRYYTDYAEDESVATHFSTNGGVSFGALATTADPIVRTSFYRVYGDCSTMGVEDLAKNVLSVYPNPATNFVKATGDVKEMTVMNMNGKVVATSKTASVNVSALPSGVYIVKVVDAKGNVTTSKVVKK